MNLNSSHQRSFLTLSSDSREAFSFLFRQVADQAVKTRNHPWPQGLGLAIDGNYIVIVPSGDTRELRLKSVVENFKKAARMTAEMDISMILFAEHIHSSPTGILSGQLSGIIEDRSGLAIKTTSSYRYTDEVGWTFGDSVGTPTDPIVFEKK